MNDILSRARMLQAIAVFAILGLAACTWDDGSISESPRLTSAPTDTKKQLHIVDNPWTAPTQSGLDLKKSAGQIAKEPCPIEPSGHTASAPQDPIIVIRLQDGCPRFEAASTDADLTALRTQPDVVAADVSQYAVSFGGSGCKGTNSSASDDVPWSHRDFLKDIDRSISMSATPVAMIDSGMDVGHSDFEDAVYEPPIPVHSQTTDSDASRCGHGTHVAGIISAAANGKGAIGVAPGTPILPLLVEYDKANDGGGLPTARALVEASDAGVKVINMSFGLDDRNGQIDPHPNQAVEWAIRYALARDVVLIAAAGNCGVLDDDHRKNCVEENRVAFPAAYDGVISVASIEEGKNGNPGIRAKSSTANASVDIAAPGVNIVSSKALTKSDVISMSGTSMAAPFVSAVVAMMRAKNPGLDHGKIERILLATVSPRPKGGERDEYGAGIIDPSAAQAATPQLVGPAPSLATVDWQNASYDLSSMGDSCFDTSNPVQLTNGMVTYEPNESAEAGFIRLDGVVPLTIRRSVGLFSYNCGGVRASGFAGMMQTPTEQDAVVALNGGIERIGGDTWTFADPSYRLGDPASMHTILGLDPNEFAWSSAGPWEFADYAFTEVFTARLSGITQNQDSSLISHSTDSESTLRAAHAACQTALAAIPRGPIDTSSGWILFTVDSPFGVDPGQVSPVPDKSVTGMVLASPEDERQLVRFSQDGTKQTIPADTDLTAWRSVAAISLPWEPLEPGNRICVTDAAFRSEYGEGGG